MSWCLTIQAEDASLHAGTQEYSTPFLPPLRSWGVESSRERSFSVIDEFDYWRRKPELAEAVAAIKALTAVIKRSEASTMMGLEVELKQASDALKVSSCALLCADDTVYNINVAYNTILRVGACKPKQGLYMVSLSP